jgi:hypothetical protein
MCMLCIPILFCVFHYCCFFSSSMCSGNLDAADREALQLMRDAGGFMSDTLNAVRGRVAAPIHLSMRPADSLFHAVTPSF